MLTCKQYIKRSVENIYTASPKKKLGTEWSLRENEQRLLIAFRYLDKDAQNEYLEQIEREASDKYKDRRHAKEKGLSES